MLWTRADEWKTSGRMVPGSDEGSRISYLLNRFDEGRRQEDDDSHRFDRRRREATKAASFRRGRVLRTPAGSGASGQRPPAAGQFTAASYARLTALATAGVARATLSKEWTCTG